MPRKDGVKDYLYPVTGPTSSRLRRGKASLTLITKKPCEPDTIFSLPMSFDYSQGIPGFSLAIRQKKCYCHAL